jgi:serine/threonine-protein kinase
MNALANIDGLKVAARTSSFAFKGRKAEISDIARALNVRTILDGSVRRSGDQLRITVQLINAADGYHLWSERYDREMRDVFAIQDEITQAVVDTLKVKLRVKMSPTQKPEDLRAYELYLKGKYHLAKLTPPDLQTSIQYFSQATAIDPSYARAFVALADAYLRLSIAAELPSGEFFPKSKAAAQRAIELDPKSCEVYVALAWIAFWYDWDWQESERLVRRALEIDPNSTEARTAFAHLLSNSGRHSQALAEIARARELDPLSLFAGAMEGQFLLHAGATDPALTVLLKVIELEPNFWLPHLFAASVYIEKQMPNEALDEARLARQLSRGSTQAAAFEAFALALAGKRPEAAALVDEVESSKERYLPPYHAALLQKALGNTNAALTQLERGVEERDVKMVFLNVEPKWNDLRSDPRFLNVIERADFTSAL